MSPILIKHMLQRVGALAPLNMFNTMLLARLLQNWEIGALSCERTSMAPYPIKCVMHEVGQLASQILSMQGRPLLLQYWVVCALSCEITSMPTLLRHIFFPQRAPLRETNVTQEGGHPYP